MLPMMQRSVDAALTLYEAKDCSAPLHFLAISLGIARRQGLRKQVASRVVQTQAVQAYYLTQLALTLYNKPECEGVKGSIQRDIFESGCWPRKLTNIHTPLHLGSYTGEASALFKWRPRLLRGACAEPLAACTASEREHKVAPHHVG